VPIIIMFTLLVLTLLGLSLCTDGAPASFNVGSLIHEYNHNQQLQYRQHPSSMHLQQLTAAALVSSSDALTLEPTLLDSKVSIDSFADDTSGASPTTSIGELSPSAPSSADLAPSALLASLASRASSRPSSQLASNSNASMVDSSISAPAGGCPEGPFPHRELDVASKAFLAPVVFTGQLVSLADDYAGRIAATFRVLKTLKNEPSSGQAFPGTPLPDSAGHVVLYFVRKPGFWFQPPHCAVYLNATAYAQLRLQARYVLFAAAPLPDLLRLHQLPLPTAAPQTADLTNETGSADAPALPAFSLHYLSAFAPPEPLNKRTYKSVFRVTCKRCRKSRL
jgi:hypothetical protein